MRRLLALLVVAGALVAPAAAQARPPYELAKSLTIDRAWRHCYAWYEIDPYSRRCSNVAIVTGYTHYNASCRYFTFVTERNRQGRVLRVRIKSCDRAGGGYTTSVYAIDGYLSGIARVKPDSGLTNPAVQFFTWLGL